MPGHYMGGGSSTSSGPAGGASSGGNYGGDSSGGYSDQERGASQAATRDTHDEYATIINAPEIAPPVESEKEGVY